ncbi:hypothetical protein [Acetobacter sp.]|uniref:hypothetical protein n=1 Tax=Acetobacter sp. TaxID=440 RepID=UPI0039ECD90A
MVAFRGCNSHEKDLTRQARSANHEHMWLMKFEKRWMAEKVPAVSLHDVVAIGTKAGSLPGQKVP